MDPEGRFNKGKLLRDINDPQAIAEVLTYFAQGNRARPETAPLPSAAAGAAG